MRIAVPQKINIDSINITENETEWNNTDTYAADQEVRKNHKLYKSVQSSNTGNDPETDTGTWWTEIGATNAYKIVDKYLSTQSVNPESIEIKFTASKIDTMAFFALEGNSVRVVVKDPTETNTYMDKTVVIQKREVVNWFSYFFEDYSSATDLFVKDIPLGLDFKYTVTISNPGGNAKIGKIVAAKSRALGCCLYEPTSTIVDYSKKVIDETGETYLAQGRARNKFDLEVLFDTGQYDHISKTLKELRGMELLFIVDESGAFETFVAYGFYKNHQQTLKAGEKSRLNLNIEGLL